MSKDFTDSIGFLLHSLVCKMEKEADNFIELNFQISYHQFLILMHIYEVDGINQKQIATSMTYTEAAISRQMVILKEKNLINIIENKQNRREKIATLTKNGSEILKKIITLITNKTNDLTNKLTKDEQKNFLNYLQILNTAI